MEIKKGTRIIMLEDYSAAPKGYKGEVIVLKPPIYSKTAQFGIEFDKFMNGHDCYNSFSDITGEYGYCQWVPAKFFKPISKVNYNE